MAVVSWMMLAFLLSAAGSVNADWLSDVVQIIKKEYKKAPQVCIAVKIPVNLGPDQLRTYLHTDSWKNLRDDYYRRDGLSVRTNVIVATYTDNDHAEARVLRSINQLVQGGEGHFLLFYTYLSPCAVRCANARQGAYGSILNQLNNMYTQWTGDKALVFEKPCTRLGQTQIGEDELKTSFQNLGDHGLGRTNLFRCYAPSNNFQCFQCFANENARNVAPACLDDSGQGWSAARRSPSPGPSYCPGEQSPRALTRRDSDMSISSGGSPSGSPSRNPRRNSRQSRSQSPATRSHRSSRTYG